MHLIGKLDKEIYKCVTEDIVTDEVIITDNQIGHIRERHPNDYERFAQYFSEIVSAPDYIIETNKPYTALILKEILAGKYKYPVRVRHIHLNDRAVQRRIRFILYMLIDADLVGSVSHLQRKYFVSALLV